LPPAAARSNGEAEELIYPPIPGPADRVHFLDEQRHHRRVGRRYAGLGILAVLVAGLPMSLVVTPLVVLVTAVAVRVTEMASGEAGLLPGAELVMAAGRRAIDSLSEGRVPSLQPSLVLGMVLPGALAVLALWLVVRRLLSKGKTDGVLKALGTRDTLPGDAEEHQLRNLAEEMAIVAGLPAPGLRLIDGSAANAAAIGTGPDDAVLIVGRGLLDRLDRDETQAIIGHLVASVGNGDLGVARFLLSIQQTLGVLTAVLDAPFGPRSRRLLGQLFLTAVGSRHSDPAMLSNALTGSATGEAEDLSEFVEARGKIGALGWLLRLPLLPFFFIAATARITAILMSSAVFGPAFAALWRRRRRLADAMAVQLTRNPDALARALDRLANAEHRVAGGAAMALMFVVWQPSDRKTGAFGSFGWLAPSVDRRRQALRRMGATSVAPTRRIWRARDFVSSNAMAILLPLAGVVVLLPYLAVLTLIALLVFNFLFLGLLLWAIVAGLDLIPALL
jgi:Zn-dependent protease with chaperone function